MPEIKKIPRLGAKKMPVYSKISGLDTTIKGNQEKTDDYTVNQSKAYNKDNPRPNFENVPKGSTFKMKYQRNNSAFPFKSPMKAFIQIGGTSTKNVNKSKTIDKSKTKIKSTGDKSIF